MKRFPSCFLILALLAGMLTACQSEPPADTGESQTGPADTSDVETTRDSLPALNYEGAEVCMFVPSNLSFAEFFVEEQTGDIVDDAIYDRNLAVSERLNVSFSFRAESNTWAERNTYADMISQSALAGDAAYDIVAGYSMSVASLAASGVLIDLTSTEYLDFSKPWWSDSLLAESTVNGKLYFASGDISTSMLYYMYGTYFNKDILTDFGLENPYDLVDNNQWTIDKMLEMSRDIYEDLDRDGKKSKNDRFGFATMATYCDPFWFSAGLRTTEINEDGIPEISDDFTSERAAKLVEMLTGFFHDTDDGLLDGDIIMFSWGNTLFTNHELLHAATALRDADFAYGLVPIPKYDAGQEEYVTVASFPYNLYGIPIDAKDPDMSSAVMEALASEGYYNVTPVVFETAMKVKYTTDEDSARMYDIIRSSVSFDFGRVFCDSLGAHTYSLFRHTVANNNTAWSSDCASALPAMEEMLNELVSFFEEE